MLATMPLAMGWCRGLKDGLMSSSQNSKDVPPFKARYENYIGGEWHSPVDGNYLTNHSPVDGRILCEVPASTAADIERALDAAHKARVDGPRRRLRTGRWFC